MTRLLPKTALLVIDVQIAIVEGAWCADEVLTVIADLQRRARAAASPVIFLQHNHARFVPMMKGAASWAIHPMVAPDVGDLVIDKTASDGFFETTLQAELDRLGVGRLIVTGLQTEFCVDATCRAALSRGFDIVLAADAHTTSAAVMPAETTIRHHNYALGNLAHPNRAIVVTPGPEIRFA